jgi:hypothetical protein
MPGTRVGRPLHLYPPAPKRSELKGNLLLSPFIGFAHHHVACCGLRDLVLVFLIALFCVRLGLRLGLKEWTDNLWVLVLSGPLHKPAVPSGILGSLQSLDGAIRYHAIVYGFAWNPSIGPSKPNCCGIQEGRIQSLGCCY